MSSPPQMPRSAATASTKSAMDERFRISTPDGPDGPPVSLVSDGLAAEITSLPCPLLSMMVLCCQPTSAPGTRTARPTTLRESGRGRGRLGRPCRQPASQMNRFDLARRAPHEVPLHALRRSAADDVPVTVSGQQSQRNRVLLGDLLALLLQLGPHLGLQLDGRDQLALLGRDVDHRGDGLVPACVPG